MAIETKRGCGFRKVGDLYLMGGVIGVECDRLPYALDVCPICGAGVRFTRSMTEIDARKLFGNHDEQPNIASIVGEVTGHGKVATCTDTVRPCHMCDPVDDVAYVMMVGVRHYPTPLDFLAEAKSMGISKKIPFIPKRMKLGETVVFLAHPKAIQVKKEEQTPNGSPDKPILIDADETEYKLGIFCAFVAKAIEMPVWQNQLTNKKREVLEKRGITPIPIPTGDRDHAKTHRA